MEANLGSTIRAIDGALPHLLQRSMPAAVVGRHIALHVLPEQLGLAFHGAVAYRAVQALAQAAITPWLLPRGTQLCALHAELSRAQQICDRRYTTHWVSVLPYARRVYKPIAPGRLIESLGLAPHEYPVLAGTFEFAFTSDGALIREHVVRNVEYMAKPAEPSVCL